MYHSSNGTLHYFNTWIVLKADDEIARYYRYWVKKTYYTQLNTPYNGAHVTVLAGKYTEPANKEFWGHHENEKIEFSYDSSVQITDHYYWLPVQCQRLIEIRRELGLSDQPYWPYHLSIGNSLNL